ncbi:MAG: group II intron reverse transcriptase/maturase, partial [Deltaproteobacteria bacterium]|nr:group II intron reverse transcriptase/maturase [Deltaproteobacteria bacterium]
KVYRAETLKAAWQKVAANRGAAGVDGQSVERFAARAEMYLQEISVALERRTYRPTAVRRVEIPKGRGKFRPLGIPVVKDRIVQTALKFVLEPIFEREFLEMSYGFRPGLSSKDALREVDGWLKEGYTFEANGLSLSPEKTQVGDCREEGQGFEFLGYGFEAGRRWVRRKSLMAIRERIRMRTKRTRGDSLGRIIVDLNPILRGWFNYFKHAHRMTFSGMDGFVRRRLRAILRKQDKRPGMGRCREDHQRWPNKFFATQGLFTMIAARELASQSR